MLVTPLFYYSIMHDSLLWCVMRRVDVLKVIKRYRHYFPRPLAILAINRILMYVDDPVTMESVLTAPECLNKSFLHNSFFARHGILHAEGIFY